MNQYKFSDLVLGMTESFEATITSEMMDQFLVMSGDTNPLHTDASYAKEKGFPDRVVYGMLTSALYSKLVGVYLPGKYCLLQEVKTSFHKPVFIGDTLNVFGEVAYLNDAFSVVEIKAHIINQDGVKVSKAKIKAGIL